MLNYITIVVPQSYEIRRFCPNRFTDLPREPILHGTTVTKALDGFANPTARKHENLGVCF